MRGWSTVGNVATIERPVAVSVIFGMPARPRTVPLRRRVLSLLVVAILCVLVVESAMFLIYGPVELRNSWRWVVSTHLIDVPYHAYVARQKRIRKARANLDMERARSHPIYGWTFNPGFRIDDPDVQIHINAHALRGEEFPIAKPAGEIRVLCLGGSTTAGEEVREAGTYPAQLQAMLRARNPGTAIRVINAGIPTYDVPGSQRLYELNLYRFDADIVTIYHGINDLFSHRGADADIARRRNYTARPTMPFYFEGEMERSWSIAPLAPALDALARNSYLFSMGQEVGHLAAARLRPPRARPDEAGLETFERQYRALGRAIAGSQAVPLPMTFAISWPGDFDPADRRRIETSFQVWTRGARATLQTGSDIIQRQNDAIRRVAEEEGWTVGEIAGRIPPDRAHFLDVCHLTHEGNRRIAEALVANLQPLIDARRTR